MKKKKHVGITALLPLVLFNLTIMPVYAEVSDYQSVDTGGGEETSAKCEVIYKGTYDFSETIPKYPELEVSDSGYEGVYDGNSHGITVDCKTDGAVILYSSDGKTYTSKNPAYKDAGTYLTYFKVEKKGYTPVAGSATVKIMEAEIVFDTNDYSGIFDGKFHGIDLSVQTGGCKILYSEDGINFSSRKPEYREPGTYIVYYRILRENYATVTGSSKVTITAKDNAINSNDQSGDSIKQNTGSNVQTGDDSHILFYGLLSAGSGICLIKKKRKERKNL